ncbi:hypothetical protein [Microcoleus sp. D3_18_C2]|uniref:hypothetical protein n=1 Tax=Microcoleus sp. D3_18_C2 TaxID=3055334 RepID=UPI002FD6F5C6
MPVPQELLEMFISPLKRTFAMSQGIHSLADWRTQPGTSYNQLPITSSHLLWQKD